MDDLKLQLLAAQAAGLEVRRGKGHQSDMLFRQVEDSRGIVTGVEWSPLKDDGDALRLAVKLCLSVEVWAGSSRHGQGVTIAEHDDVSVEEPHNGDANAATRRAITRAAAAMATVAPGAGGGGR